MAATTALARVAGMLVLEPDRLDEADRIELTRARGVVHLLDELLLVTQMRATRSAGRERGVVVQRLVVELEHLVRAIRPDRVRGRIRIGANAGNGPIRPSRRADVAVGVRPAAGIPRPADR